MEGILRGTLGALMVVLASVSKPGAGLASDRKVDHERGIAMNRFSLAGVSFRALTSTCLNASDRQPGSGPVRSCRPDERSLKEIALWVAAMLGEPEAKALPSIRFLSQDAMRAIRLREFNSASDIVALYEDATETIFLREGWTGQTTAEISILVHEMVHHLQKQAGLTFACPEAREAQAYAVQAAWLSRYGQSLEGEFAINPLTLLVLTNCAM